MKFDVKLVFLLFVVLLQISYVEGWWGSRRSSSSRSSSSSSSSRRLWRSPSSRSSSSRRFWRSPSSSSSSSRRFWRSPSSSSSSSRRSSGWRRRSSRRPASPTSQRPHDVKTKEGLTKIFNKPIQSSQRVERPFDGFLGKIGIKHSGQLVTTKDGSKYLIHNAGKGIGTVVTDAKHMSDRYQTDGPSKKVGGKATVGKFVEKGGSDYNWLLNNCHHATKRMGKLGRKKRCVG